MGKSVARRPMELTPEEQSRISDRIKSAVSLAQDLAPLIRAARALLGVTQQELADHANVSLATVIRLESKRSTAILHPESVQKMVRTLEDEGIEFVLSGPESGFAWGVMRREVNLAVTIRSSPERILQIVEGKRQGFPSERAQVGPDFEIYETPENWVPFDVRRRHVE